MPSVNTRGARIDYTRTGEGPAVVLIQGVGVVGRGWRPQIEGLSDRFSLIAIDNRGIGNSTCTDGRITIDAMVDDTLAVMDAEKVSRAHVGGHSMGGLIGQALALRAPDRVQSLALLCTFARGVQATALTPTLLWIGLRTRIGTAAMRRNAFLELVMPPEFLASTDRPALAATFADLFGHDLAVQPPIVMQQLRATRKCDLFDRLHELAHIKTLVVAAAGDRIALPRFGRLLAEAIPGSQLIEVPDAGHGLPIHRAARINDLLAAHWLLPPVAEG